MVMTPVKVGEHVLVDGGVADPVPAEVVLDMGADLTVAVNVVPPDEARCRNGALLLVPQDQRVQPADLPRSTPRTCRTCSTSS